MSTTTRDSKIAPRIVLAEILRALRLGGSRQPVSVWLQLCTPTALSWLTWLQHHCSGVKADHGRLRANTNSTVGWTAKNRFFTFCVWRFVIKRGMDTDIATDIAKIVVGMHIQC